MSRSRRIIDCIYCGEPGSQAQEHVVPRWLWTELGKGGLHRTPTDRKHLFRGNRRVPNVCVTCNNGPLHDLDDIAVDWWRCRGTSLGPVLEASPPFMGRWVAKIGVNLDAAE